MTSKHSLPRLQAHKLARVALFGFILTVLIARACVFLIMSHQVPNLYFFMHGTHVHHLNYGIFVLSIVGGYAVFCRPVGRRSEFVALAYGFAMALTFDEFGMWLHLGGSYWQRASVDVVIIIAALFALMAYSRSIVRFESRHFWGFLILLVAIGGFSWVIYAAGNHMADLFGPRLQELELSSSP